MNQILKAFIMGIRTFQSLLFLMCTIFLLTSGCKKDKDIAPINFNPSITYGSMTDQDGNIYKTVSIGTQTWMAENLKTTRYRNGDPVTKVINNTEWINLTSGAYCFYYNDISTRDVYGILYNWYAVEDDRNLSPPGWHIPVQAEWDTLIKYLGGGQAACIKLRENGTVHWVDYNAGNANQSGFTGLPSGYREGLEGNFYGINYYGWWWGKDEDEGNSVRAWMLGLKYWWEEDINWNNTDFMTIQKTYGISVRCLKDN